MSMQDKTVIITGGSRGMGQRLALKLGAEKANVVVNYPPGNLKGSIADNTKRKAFAGPCKVGWREGLARVVANRTANAT